MLTNKEINESDYTIIHRNTGVIISRLSIANRQSSIAYRLSLMAVHQIHSLDALGIEASEMEPTPYS